MEHGVVTGQDEGAFGFGPALSEGVEESDITAIEVRLDDGTLVMAELTATVNIFEDSDVVVQFAGDSNDDFDWETRFPVSRGNLIDNGEDCLDLERFDPVMVQLENGAEVEARWMASCLDLYDRDGSWTLSGPVWLDGRSDGSWEVWRIADR
jgi:hypothetical protein